MDFVEKILIGIGGAVVAIAILGLFSLILAFPVMWLWNGVLPNLLVNAEFRQSTSGTRGGC